jgi:hypothetical protein
MKGGKRGREGVGKLFLKKPYSKYFRPVHQTAFVLATQFCHYITTPETISFLIFPSQSKFCENLREYS